MSVRDKNIRVPCVLLSDPDRFGGALEGACKVGRPRWNGERLIGLDPATDAGLTLLVLPRLVEPHCHLDKCHSQHRLAPVGGDLSAAIAAQAKDKSNWSEDDLTARALQGLDESRRAGCGVVRSHIDWSDCTAPPLAWDVLTALSPDDTGVPVQWAALTGIDQMADAALARDIARTVAKAGGVLGSFVLHHDDQTRAAGLTQMFDLADRFGLMLDFHVDEGFGTYNGLEAIADMALSTGFEGPILCSHAVSLMDRTQDEVARIAGKLARANITICALPTTNLYLQGRGQGTPERRGITRLQELRAEGVRIIVGSDNVADAFCPVGQHDPMAALHLAVLGAHLDPPLEKWLSMVTLDAATALGRDAVFVDGAKRQELLVSFATSLPDLIAGRSLRYPADEIINGFRL